MHCIILYLAFSCFSHSVVLFLDTVWKFCKSDIKCIKRLEVVQREMAELGEQYTLYHKKAEQFISLCCT